ncbi:hypothetical protein N0614_09510 [Pseudomonas aeruginosa]|nr:hypothetical protein [Pseudomonas aeruginosa]
MQELKINKHVYDTMILHYSGKLTPIAQEFNDYLTADNLINDYWHVDNMIDFNCESMNEKTSFITFIKPEIKEQLKCGELRESIPEIDNWYHTGEEPGELLSKYFQLFVTRKIDYFGLYIKQKEMQGDFPDNGVHPNRLALLPDGLQRSVVALMSILLNGCSASEQERLLTVLQFQLDCDFSKNEELSLIVDLLVQAKYYRL